MLDQVISIISEYLDIPKEQISAQHLLIQDLGFNSFDVVSIIGRFEDEFDIEVPDRQIRTMKSVSDIVSFIESQIS